MPTPTELTALELIKSTVADVTNELSHQIRDTTQLNIIVSSALMTIAEKMLIELHGNLRTSEMLYNAADVVATKYAIEKLEGEIRDGEYDDDD